MNFRDPNNWLWEWLYITAVFAVFVWRLYANASDFDSTEIVTVVQSGMFAITAVGVLVWIRGRHERLWRKKNVRNRIAHARKPSKSDR